MNKSDFPSTKSPVRENVITDNMIKTSFKNTSFGEIDNNVKKQREYLYIAVLKILAGYWCGHTIFCIMKELDLITDNRHITKRGRLFLYQHAAKKTKEEL